MLKRAMRIIRLSKNLSQNDRIEEPHWGPTMMEQLPANCRVTMTTLSITGLPPLLPSGMLHHKVELRETKSSGYECYINKVIKKEPFKVLTGWQCQDLEI